MSQPKWLTPKTKKGLKVVIPILIAGTIIFLLNRKKKPTDLTAATEADVKDEPVKSTPAASLFPLKSGSKNAKVKELQRIIGLAGDDVDGDFGPQTLAALKAFAGTTSVANQAELDKLLKKANGVTNSARATDLVKKFKAGGVSMYTIKPASAQLVTVDAYGAIQYSGKSKVFAGGKIYSNADYVLTGSTKGGDLMFVINKGNLAGTYVVDPSLISLT